MKINQPINPINQSINQSINQIHSTELLK